MIKHSQFTQRNKSVISLQYLKKVRNGGHFWQADKRQFSTSWSDMFKIPKIGSW